ncbi:MAG: acyl-CoA thioesterase [Gammaproteobacteria bacterium]|nr:acyl-CoA thioesterase [Gammaproteobacteria bacterium]
MPEGRLLYELSLPVRWGDMDSLGHVNNIVYFQYFESIRLAWCESLGFAPLGQNRTGQVIVNTQAEFLKPVVYPATLLLRMGGHSPGRSSFVSSYTLVIDGTLYTRGSAKIVWVDYASNQSIPLPDNVRSQLVDEHE